MKLFWFLSAAAMFSVLIFAPSASFAGSVEDELMAQCLKHNQTETCCECSLEVMKSELSDQEMENLVSVFRILDQMQAPGNDQARQQELMQQMSELQAKFDQEKMNMLDQKIRSECNGVCP